MKKKLAIFTAAVGFFTLCNVVLYTRKLRSDEMARFWHWSALSAAITNCTNANYVTPPSSDDQNVICSNNINNSSSSSGGALGATLTVGETNATWRRRQHHRDIPPEGRSRDRNRVDDRPLPPTPPPISSPENVSAIPIDNAATPAPGKPWPPPGTVTAPGSSHAVTRNGTHPASFSSPPTSAPAVTVVAPIRIDNPNRSASGGDRPLQSSSTVAAAVVQPPPPAPIQQPLRHRQQQFVLDNRTFYIGEGSDSEVHLPVPLTGLNLTVKVTFGVSLLDDIVARPLPSSTAATPSGSHSLVTSTLTKLPVAQTGSTVRLNNNNNATSTHGLTSAPTAAIKSGTTKAASSKSAATITTTTTATSSTSGGLTILNQHPFHYLIDVQDLCAGGHQVSLLVMVTTSVSHFEHRQAIRDTWGTLARNNAAATSGVRLVFVMGRPADASVEPAVVREAIQHADIVQEDFLDTYKNLTLKTMALLKWAHTHCANARFVMKSDDDMFIHLPNLLKYLRNLRQTKSQLFGRLVKGARPLRSKSSKYFVPVSEYRGHVYPDYLSGTAYVMSSDVAPRLLATASKTPIFFFEDVFITGICAKKAGLVRRNHVGFVYYKRPVKGCAYAKVISGHNNTPNDLRNIWKDLQKKTKC